MDPLVVELVAKQDQLLLSDRQFAPKLGISNSWWSGIRRGKYRLGRNTLARIKELYPELGPDVDAYWLRKVASKGLTSAIPA